MSTPPRRAHSVVLELKNAIEQGEYPPGSKLPSEQQLVRRFAVSRTVIREAIADLRASQLVVTQQGKGAFVCDKPISDVLQLATTGATPDLELTYLMELRIAIESETAYLATQKRSQRDVDQLQKHLREMQHAIDAQEPSTGMDARFHFAIAAAAKNPHFVALLTYVYQRLNHKDPLIPATRKQQALKEHEHLCHAIERGDPDAARSAMRLHLSGTKARLLNAIQQPYASNTTKGATD